MDVQPVTGTDQPACQASACCGQRRCQCGASFTCDWSAGRSPCWCQQYPAVMPMSGATAGATSCLCPACLERAIALRLAESSANG
jgi:hypothetical protein